jgi:Family of unknown function (DUF6525)
MKKEGNTRVSGRPTKRSDLEVYDALPVEIRAALQEGAQEWSAHKAASLYKKFRRSGEAKAISSVVRLIEVWNWQDISYGRAWWPKHPKRGMMYNSPHFRANATMQKSGRS